MAWSEGFDSCSLKGHRPQVARIDGTFSRRRRQEQLASLHVLPAIASYCQSWVARPERGLLITASAAEYLSKGMCVRVLKLLLFGQG